MDKPDRDAPLAEMIRGCQGTDKELDQSLQPRTSQTIGWNTAEATRLPTQECIDYAS
ncbi:MAG: hypothetical protein ACRDBM_00005 [Sporomusa sp.]